MGFRVLRLAVHRVLRVRGFEADYLEGLFRLSGHSRREHKQLNKESVLPNPNPPFGNMWHTVAIEAMPSWQLLI